MPHRYYAPTLSAESLIELPEDESHHAAHVLRAKVGDPLVLFDGQNHESDAVVQSIERRVVRCRVGAVRDVNREPSGHIELAVALPKGDRSRSVIENAVQLGAAVLVPLECRRSVAKMSPSGLRKLKRYVIDASKQCGRNRLMEIRDPVTWDSWMSASESSYSSGPRDELPTRIVAHPSGGRRPSEVIDGAGALVCAVGPEGGFTDDEIRTARENRWNVVNLGPRILRVESAVSALLTIATGLE